MIRRPRNPEAMIVAWEQIAVWRGYMTAAEAASVVGSNPLRGWDDVASHLAMMWLDLKKKRRSSTRLWIDSTFSQRQEAA